MQFQIRALPAIGPELVKNMPQRSLSEADLDARRFGLRRSDQRLDWRAIRDQPEPCDRVADHRCRRSYRGARSQAPPKTSSFENVSQRLEPLRHGLFQALRAVHLLFRSTVEGH